MPREVTDPEEFMRLAEGADECRVKKVDGETKLKVRARGFLYTIRLEAKAADELVAKLKCSKVEF